MSAPDPAASHDVVVAILREPFQTAGLGNPSPAADGPIHVMWHTEAACEDRPCPDSPIWTHGFGCYDVIVQWRADEHHEPGRLVVHTEGGTMLDAPWPDSRAALESHLHDLAAAITERVRDDIRTFETENGGYLPGTEPSVGP